MWQGHLEAFSAAHEISLERFVTLEFAESAVLLFPGVFAQAFEQSPCVGL